MFGRAVPGVQLLHSDLNNCFRTQHSAIGYDGHMRPFVIVLATTFTLSAQAPKVTGVLNGASFGTRLCAGTLASLFGSNLATATTSAQSIPLPTDLSGTKVLKGPWVAESI